MIEPLQGFGFRESNYERPNQTWECGWACAGEPCHIGPNSKGICQAYRECVPYQEGDRFRCARPQNFGGSCEREHGGPLPNGACSQRIMECQPVRTLRSRRQLFTMAVSAMALGVCLLMFGGSWGKSFSSPGELTLQHHSKAHTCKDCHSAADGEFDHGDIHQWVSGALTSEMSSGDTMRCLNCHQELEQNHLSAHGLDPQALAASSERIGQASDTGAEPILLSLIETTIGNPQDHAGGLACARCHHEHRGRTFDLTLMSSSQCQSCHTGKFHSFSDGHPEFSGFPYGRRPRLYFDHATHYRVHFAAFRRIKSGAEPAEELAPVGEGDSPKQHSCYACHQPDSSGKTMPVRGFEQSCAACHGAEIGDDALPGIAFFALPRLNVAGFKELGIKIGRWPSTEAEPDDVSLPPLMDLLLSVDPQLIDVREKIRARGLKQLSKQEPVLIERYLWGIKLLMNELVNGGRPEFRRRLKQAIASSVGPAELKLELAAMSGVNSADPTFVDALTATQKRWFPKLADELTRYNQGDEIESEPIDVSSDDQMMLTNGVASGWYTTVENGAIRIRYRVTGHADSLIRSWLDVIGQVPNILVKPSQTTNVRSESFVAKRALSDLFGVLSDRAAAYRCLDCHSADKLADGRLKINWLGKRTSPGERLFTKFSHAPHVKLLAQNNCALCHETQTQTSDINFFRPEYVKVQDNWAINSDPHSTHASGFAPLTKKTCAECHTSQQAGDSCLKCHNYHIHR